MYSTLHWFANNNILFISTFFNIASLGVNRIFNMYFFIGKFFDKFRLSFTFTFTMKFKFVFIYQNVGCVRNKQKEQSTGEPFNLSGCSKHNMRFNILEKVMSTDPLYGREWEKFLSRKFNTFYNGINKEPWWLQY